MIISEGSILYSVTRGSDLERDGMYLELKRDDLASDAVLAEVFYSDKDGSFVFTPTAQLPIPLPVLEKFIKTANELLPPKKSVDNV